MPSKPHIRKLKPKYRTKRCWLCTDGKFSGRGMTPVYAYRDWLRTSVFKLRVLPAMESKARRRANATAT